MVMKLFYSQNSPYARIARIAVQDASLLNEVELIEVINRSPDSPLLQYSPVCRVPTLVADQLVIGEARDICAYIDGRTGKQQFVQSGNPNWQTASLESMVIGFLDGVAAWVRENRRDHISAHLIDVEQLRANRCLKYFNSKMEFLPNHFQTWNFANIALACALDLMTFHNLVDNWQATYPDLKIWYDIQTSRSSMKATAPN